MGHPRELLKSIESLLLEEYPKRDYTYEFERRIPGTRMAPDIWVKREEQIVCAVEIGYTRPEKLTAYRQELKIPDVRWYAKDGVLHSEVEQRAVKVRLQVECEPTHAFYAYDLRHYVDCVDCKSEWLAEIAELKRAGANRDWREFERHIDDEAPVEVATLVITDYCMAFLPSFCDKCGGYFLGFEDPGFGLLYEIADSTPQELGRDWGARRELSWSEACDLVQRRFGLTLKYTEGLFIDEESKRDWRRKLQSITEQERTTSSRIVSGE
jgi:hypothetical protein